MSFSNSILLTAFSEELSESDCSQNKSHLLTIKKLFYTSPAVMNTTAMYTVVR